MAFSWFLVEFHKLFYAATVKLKLFLGNARVISILLLSSEYFWLSGM